MTCRLTGRVCPRPSARCCRCCWHRAYYGESGDLRRRSPAAPNLADGGTVLAARVTGQIMGSNPCPIIVPCHRVVAGDGLGGYSGGAGLETKRWLLIFEGALPPTLDWDPAGPGTG